MFVIVIMSFIITNLLFYWGFTYLLTYWGLVYLFFNVFVLAGWGVKNGKLFALLGNAVTVS